MPTYYVADAANGGSDSNDGLTSATPKLTMFPTIGGSISWNQNNLNVYLKCGSRWDLPSTSYDYSLIELTGANSGLVLSQYGSGAKPIMSGFHVTTGSDWTYDGTNGVYWYLYGTDPTRTGVVVQRNSGRDDRVLTWIDWNTDIATTAALMSPGYWTRDTGTNRVYVKPFAADDPTASACTLLIARARHCIIGSSAITNALIEGIEFQGAHGSAINMSNAGTNYIDTVTVQDCRAKFHGGYYSGSVWLGSGFQIALRSKNVTFQRNHISDVFDSPLTAQVFGNDATDTVCENLYFQDNLIEGGALGGVEIAAQSGATDGMQAFRNIYIRRNTFRYQGQGYAGTGDNSPADTAAILVKGFNSHVGAGVDSCDGFYAYDNRIESVTGFGIYMENVPGRCYMERNRIRNCSDSGIEFYADRTNNTVAGEEHRISAYIRANDVDSCGTGINYTAGSAHTSTNTAEIVGNTCVQNTGSNILVGGTPSGQTLTIENNVCEGGAYGINVSAGTVSEDYNNCHGASVANFNGVSAGAHSISTDPALVRPPYLNRLNPASPCIGAGRTPDYTGQSGITYSTDDIGSHPDASEGYRTP